MGLLPVVQIFIDTSDLGGALIVGSLGPFIIVGSAAFAFAGRDLGRHALLAYFGFTALLYIFGWIADVPDEGVFLSNLGNVATSIVFLGVAALLYLPISNVWYNSR